MKTDACVILIIDDQPEVADLVASVLHSAGYQPAVARSGREGLRLARETGPDLILCDHAMPGLSGLHVIAALRAMPVTAGVPLVLMSGYDPVEFEGSGADAMLTKPFQMKDLLELVRTLLPLRHVWAGEAAGQLAGQPA